MINIRVSLALNSINLLSREMCLHKIPANIQIYDLNKFFFFGNNYYVIVMVDVNNPNIRCCAIFKSDHRSFLIRVGSFMVALWNRKHTFRRIITAQILDAFHFIWLPLILSFSFGELFQPNTLSLTHFFSLFRSFTRNACVIIWIWMYYKCHTLRIDDYYYFHHVNK